MFAGVVVSGEDGGAGGGVGWWHFMDVVVLWRRTGVWKSWRRKVESEGRGESYLICGGEDLISCFVISAGTKLIFWLTFLSLMSTVMLTVRASTSFTAISELEEINT